MKLCGKTGRYITWCFLSEKRNNLTTIGIELKEMDISNDYIYCLPPVVNENTHTIILGSMPGPDSLKKGEYYAHEDNIFWDIIYRTFSPLIDCDDLIHELNIPYHERLERLLTNGVGLWDVYSQCIRPSASDKDIQSEISNDFSTFFQTYKGVKRVLLNGGNAHDAFIKNSGIWPKALDCRKMQSTSGQNKTNAFFILREWKSALLEKEYRLPTSEKKSGK